MNDSAPKTASDMAAALARGAVSARALAQASLDTIAAADARIRAFITVLPDSALAGADASDARRAAGQARGPLDGIPFAVKDNIAVNGVVTTCGTRAFAAPALADAVAVARLRAAGAVLIGTLNMHEGALGATTDNPFWGQCQNPLRDGFTPGGSSGGSAAAIAAEMVPLSLGTDTMGSVRIPAAYCGLWGLKPSRGRIPDTGLVHLSWKLDTIGPLARSPADLSAALSVLGGDAAGVPSGPVPASLGDVTLGLPDAATLADCEPVVLDSFDQLVRALRQAGADLRPVAIPGWNPGALRRAGLLVSEVEGAETLGDAVDGPGLSDGFRDMLTYGRRAKAGRLARAYQAMGAATTALAHAMTGIDGLLLPTAPQRAFAHAAPVPASQADFTALANIAGVPALSLPIAASDGGLPVGAQIIGPDGSDDRLLAVGALLQRTAPVKAWADRA